MKKIESYITKVIQEPSKLSDYLEKLYKTIFYQLLIRSGIAKYNLPLFKGQYLKADHQIDKSKLNHYMACKNFIEGWFWNEAAQMFLWIDYLQKKEGIEGDLFEIGVHHGKSTIMLGLMTNKSKEKLGTCDIFSYQELNISHSGKGTKSKDIFLDNFKSYFDNIDFLNIYKKSSSKLSVGECGKCRFFHIDGGHTVDETYNDLNLASSTITEKGIVAIDDFYHALWTEVTEGIFKFLSTSKSLLPFAIGFNKLFLCKPSMHKWYSEHIQQKDWNNYIKGSRLQIFEKNLLGIKVQIFIEAT